VDLDQLLVGYLAAGGFEFLDQCQVLGRQIQKLLVEFVNP